MLKILSVENNSPASRAGLQKDDIIVRFDDNQAIDMLDMAYYDCQEKYSVTVNRDEQLLTLNIVKQSFEQTGIEFYENCYIEPRWCANKCLFCFVDQLPKGQRETLYVKDDDWRLSFVSGNFVTLTNVSEKELARICANKYSPLYISVHATDDNVRRKLLGNSRASDIMPILTRLANSGIVMHTQVVLTPEYNDGAVLVRTLNDLYSLYPQVASLAVVPVGLTQHRDDLCKIKSVNCQIANTTIDIVEQFDSKCFQDNGEHFVYCSDEMYISANRELPQYDYYGDFAQIENGVGLVADLNYQFEMALQDSVGAKQQNFTIVTGVSAKPFLEKLIAKAQHKHDGVNVNVVAINNTFFGSTVTVAGLVVGADIVTQISGRSDIADTLILPRVMLREVEDVFLDGMTLQQLKETLNKNIIVVGDGYDLCQTILECN